MPATDPLYVSMDADVARRLAEQRKRSPLAMAVREELLALYRRLPLGDAVADRALKAVDSLSRVIANGHDIPEDWDRSIRRAFLQEKA